jgi:hypothetical protein
LDLQFIVAIGDLEGLPRSSQRHESRSTWKYTEALNSELFIWDAPKFAMEVKKYSEYRVVRAVRKM